jgi:hypothetical protein
MSSDEFEREPEQTSLPLLPSEEQTPLIETLDAVALPVEEPKPPRLLPHLAHTLVLMMIGFGSLIVTAIGFGILIFARSGGKLSVEALRDKPILIVGFEIAIYLVALMVAWPLFSLWWHRGFLDGVYWNFAKIRRVWWVLLLMSAALSLLVELISNYLPMPKDLPMDQFFKTPSTLWAVAIFGTFLAPFIEELFFRGFLLPSLANAWEWCASKWFKMTPCTVDAAGHPDWSLSAMVFATAITSIGFAAMHADQLDSALAPLAVLFIVSVVLSVVRLHFRSLAASVLVHSGYNGTLFVITFFATDGFQHLDKIKG